jgi:phosphate transport system permease protein
VIVSVEEALQSVPRSYREASYALGSTKSQAVFRVVLPHAMPGVLTGSVLAVSRAAGEVAPILVVGAAYYLPQIPTKLSDQFMNLGYHVYIMSTQSPDVDATKPILYSTVFVLLALTFLLNAVAVAIRARMRIARRSA